MAEQQKIFIPFADEIAGMHPHGQLLFEGGTFLNFHTELDEAQLPVLEPMLKRLAAFLAGDEPYLGFESPHLPGTCYLTRYAAAKVIQVQPAWSRKVLPRNREGKVNLVDLAGLPLRA